MATGVSAFAAYWKKDKALAKKTWDILFDELKKNAGTEGITPMYYAGGTEHDNCQEISWISTNTISQWCLNVIMALDFIREALPKTLHEADLLVSRMPAGNFRKA